jgi:ankyrin repeat protein
MFDKKADPNLLTHNSQMAPLHIAACRMYPAVIELLLLDSRTNIEIYSPLHGTPLHVACAVGCGKIVQQLLLNNANISALNPKNRIPRELTSNQRILYLIDKSELRLKTLMSNNEPQTPSGSSDSSGSRQS